MITKERFVDYINELKRHIEAISNANTHLKEYDFYSLEFIGEGMIIRLLEDLMNDKPNEYGSNISYFIYDLEFGAKWQPGMITESDGTDIPMQTAEQLYDFLIKLNTYVYCTNCKHFRLDDEEIPYCPFEDNCKINNCEDSMPFENRPYYIEK